MAAAQVQQVDAAAFWARFQHLVTSLVRRRAHVEVVIVIRDGKLQIVRVNESILPTNLPVE